MARDGEPEVPIVGFASSWWDDDRLRQHAREALEARGEVDEAQWERLAKRITYVQGDYRDADSYAQLATHLRDLGVENPLFYLAIPPELFDDVIVGLTAERLNEGARVVVETPFGRDQIGRASSRTMVCTYV